VTQPVSSRTRGSVSRVASTMMSAPAMASAGVATARTGLPRCSLRAAANASRDSARRLVTRISSKPNRSSSMVTFHQADPRAPRWPSTRESALARCWAPSAVRAPVRAAVSHVPSTIPSGMPVSGSSSRTRASSLGRPRRQLPTKSPTTLIPLTCSGPRWPRRTLKCPAPPLGGARWTRGSSTTCPSPWARTAPSTAARTSARPMSRASTSGPATKRKLRAGLAGSASRWRPSPGRPCRCRPAC
jgi:hypothetical protein